MRSLLATAVILFGLPVQAQSLAKVSGPSSVGPGELVELTASGKADSYAWLVISPVGTKTKQAEKSLLFASGCTEGLTYHVVLVAVTLDAANKPVLATDTFQVVVQGGRPPPVPPGPEPVPPVPPEPEPPSPPPDIPAGNYGIAPKVYAWAMEVDTRILNLDINSRTARLSQQTRAQDAAKIAVVIKATVSKAGELNDIQAMFDAYAAGLMASGVNLGPWLPWQRQFNAEILRQSKLDPGGFKSPKQFGEFLTEAATGMGFVK